MCFAPPDRETLSRDRKPLSLGAAIFGRNAQWQPFGLCSASGFRQRNSCKARSTMPGDLRPCRHSVRLHENDAFVAYCLMLRLGNICLIPTHHLLFFTKREPHPSQRLTMHSVMLPIMTMIFWTHATSGAVLPHTLSETAGLPAQLPARADSRTILTDPDTGSSFVPGESSTNRTVYNSVALFCTIVLATFLGVSLRCVCLQA
jgi:hypothetical protein